MTGKRNVSVLPDGVTLANEALAERVRIDDEMLHCDLRDGRVISVPLAWYPRLLKASPEQRNKWKLIGRGRGIHWPDLDEDLSVKGFMAGGEVAKKASREYRYIFLRDVTTVPLRGVSYTNPSHSREVEMDMEVAR